jgi:hypothetical protein
MGWVDVAIPGAIGLLLAVNPRWFLKRSGESEKEARRVRMLRGIGFVLLAVAGLYLLAKLMMKA